MASPEKKRLKQKKLEAKLDIIMNDFCPFIYDKACVNPDYSYSFQCFGKYKNCEYYKTLIKYNV